MALHCHKIRKNRFPRSALKKIPTKKYQKTDKYDTCPICLNEYEEGVKIRILPCEHGMFKIKKNPYPISEKPSMSPGFKINSYQYKLVKNDF